MSYFDNVRDKVTEPVKTGENDFEVRKFSNVEGTPLYALETEEVKEPLVTPYARPEVTKCEPYEPERQEVGNEIHDQPLDTGEFGEE